MMDRSTEIAIVGQTYMLSRELVDQRLVGVEPEQVVKHAVRIGDRWFPVKQVLELVIDVPRSEFTSQTARRHLARLGYEVRQGPRRATLESDATATPTEWHTEANVQALLVNSLERSGWTIESQANTATKERGVDVIATRGGQTVGIEVKGFPSTRYADPSRAREVKPTAPSTQAGHWYAQAVLAAMRLRAKHPEWRSAIALPDFTRYRSLWGETQSSLEAAGIEIWWVDESGLGDRIGDRSGG